MMNDEITNIIGTMDKKHLDFTIDFETCSKSANAAVMQVAVVPWLRNGKDTPFSDEIEPYVGFVDLRTCVVEGFDFDPETVKWWASRSDGAKRAVCEDLPEPMADVLIGVLDYIRRIVEVYNLDSICLWCQGMDFDIAILRNLCSRYDVNLEDIVPHTSFRDCRTVILEGAMIQAERLCLRHRTSIPEDNVPVPTVLPTDVFTYPSKAYVLFDPLPDRYAAGSEAHDALFDAVRSSWNTWQALRWIHKL